MAGEVTRVRTVVAGRERVWQGPKSGASGGVRNPCSWDFDSAEGYSAVTVFSSRSEICVSFY